MGCTQDHAYSKVPEEGTSWPLTTPGGGQQSLVSLGLWLRLFSLCLPLLPVHLCLHTDFCAELVSKFPCSYKESSLWV